MEHIFKTPAFSMNPNFPTKQRVQIELFSPSAPAVQAVISVPSEDFEARNGVP
jgi:hypothetical protein